MQFKITGKHIDITDSIRDYAEKKVAKLPRFYDSINEAEVIIEVQGGSMSVEILARDKRLNVFVVEVEGNDAYVCIDRAVAKVERQLSRKKTQERDDKHS